MASQFTVIHLKAVSEQGTVDLVRHAAQELEIRHTVVFGDRSVDEAISLAAGFDSDFEIPNAAIKILDYAAACKKLFAREGESDDTGVLRQEIESLLLERQASIASGEYRLAKSHEAKLLELRLVYLKELPESDHPIVAPEDVRSAFEAISK